MISTTTLVEKDFRCDFGKSKLLTQICRLSPDFALFNCVSLHSSHRKASDLLSLVELRT